jgi:hypothetical protein
MAEIDERVRERLAPVVPDAEESLESLDPDDLPISLDQPA